MCGRAAESNASNMAHTTATAIPPAENAVILQDDRYPAMPRESARKVAGGGYGSSGMGPQRRAPMSSTQTRNQAARGASGGRAWTWP